MREVRYTSFLASQSLKKERKKKEVFSPRTLKGGKRDI
jgi:hypothetical protein